MRLLVLGGTSFVGRAIVTDALRAGAEVTLFSRGRTGTELFREPALGLDQQGSDFREPALGLDQQGSEFREPALGLDQQGSAFREPALGLDQQGRAFRVARRIGDRETGDYSALRDGRWDAVVDVSGYVPRHVRQAMAVLDDRVGRYLFISSHAVYVRTGVGPGSDEDTPRRAPVRDTEELDDDTYGPCKVACEDDVVARYGTRATIVRPGKVAGPHDSQDGLTYWVRRAARGGRVALPGRPEQPVQVIDSRDLARLVVRLLEGGRPGAFNAVGPAEPTTMAELIATCARVAGSQVEIVPVPADAVPSMVPLVRPEPAWPSQQRSAARARAAGLPATPLAVTAADVLAWDRGRGEPPLARGLSQADEEKLLAGT